MRTTIKHRGASKTEESYRGIPIHAVPGVHAEVACILKARLKPGARIADLGAGHGALTQRLKDCGFLVHAYDVDAADWPIADIPCSFVDLNKPLHLLREHGPYDAICAIEVIEHLENPLDFIRNLIECANNKDCWIVISTPNPADTFSCISLFTRGIFNWFSEVHYTGGGHISILPHWMISKHFEHCGVDVQEWSFLGQFRHPGFLKQTLYRGLTRLRRAFWKGPDTAPPEGQTALIIARVEGK